MNITVAALSGSLRKESYTTKTLKAFAALAPEGVTVNLVDISDLPLLNQDLEQDLPEPVKRLHEQAMAADVVVLATPEYNRSYSPVIKNALDWGSRPQGNNCWNGKPVAVLGCTPYNLGAFGAVHHLRQVLVYLNMQPLQQPEFYLAGAADKFDEFGQLTDDSTRKLMTSVWEGLMVLAQNTP
ncbi:flavoprotein [Pedobacter yulinensis]|uniref:Flavoprotein n=1 Tax=Pedobacter yulinensis TaxID=2126353 RepID=A0A2T3HL10_9SPHI|nr:NAD(P)H-dependent oxidoreductase [Pedobacter yulinensis]PST83148.1 flavoprotein [Pedobacter yulinensis]